MGGDPVGRGGVRGRRTGHRTPPGTTSCCGPDPARTPATTPRPSDPLAGAVRLSRPLDPEIRVDQVLTRVRRRRFAECAARRVAPVLLRVAAVVGPVAVAAGVDHERLAADLHRQLLAEIRTGRRGLEVGDIDREAVRVRDACPPERLEERVGRVPAGIARVHVDAGVRQLLQPLDGALEEVVPLLVELLWGATVDQVQHCVRLQDHRGPAVADALGDLLQPGAVRVAVGGAALRELAAVAVRDVVEDQQRLPAGLRGRLGEALGLGLGVVRADPLADRLPGDLPDQVGVLVVAVLGVRGDLPGRVPVGVDPVRVAARGLPADHGGILVPVAAGRGTSREQHHRAGRGHRPRAEPAGVIAVHPLPLGCRTSILAHPGVRLARTYEDVHERRTVTGSGRTVKKRLGHDRSPAYSVQEWPTRPLALPCRRRASPAARAPRSRTARPAPRGERAAGRARYLSSVFCSGRPTRGRRTGRTPRTCPRPRLPWPHSSSRRSDRRRRPHWRCTRATPGRTYRRR